MKRFLPLVAIGATILIVSIIAVRHHKKHHERAPRPQETVILVQSPAQETPAKAIQLAQIPRPPAEQGVLYCPNCGSKRVKEDARYCAYCGERFRV